MSEHIKDYADLPQLDDDELEITTMGVGSQSGESIVMHLGDGNWIIIDSCKTCDGIVMPLYHLKMLGVELEHVNKIVCTHWHDDHIGGLSTVVEQCTNAEFYYPIVGQDNNYLSLLRKGDKAQNQSSVWKEFIACYNLAKQKSSFCGSDKLVYDDDKGIQLFTLSPSDKMIAKMLQIIADFEKSADYRRFNDSAITPNMGCSALLLVTPECKILLGADLEANRSNKENEDACINQCAKRYEVGWCNVIKKSTSFKRKKISYFKLPHHSSKTGYCNAIYTEHVTDLPISVSTVFVNNAGVKLPQKDMLIKYHDRSTEMYLTSRGPRKKDRGKGKSMLDSLAFPHIESVSVLRDEPGLVCSRKKKGQPWQTYLIGSAIQVDKAFINQYQDS